MRRLLAVGLIVLVACEARPDAPPPVDTESETTRVDRIVELLAELDDIASANGDTRFAGGPGYAASVDWATGHLEDAGYEVTRQEFQLPIVEPRPGSSVEMGGSTLQDGRDLRVMLYSPPGRVSGTLFALDFEFDAEGREGPACDPDSFAAMPRDAVVLIRPGPCFTRDQVVNAGRAGAAAILVAYPEFHTDLVLRPTLIFPQGIDIPAVALSDEAGEDLARNHDGENVSVTARTRVRRATLENVIADSSADAAEGVAMFGGHLDSVVDGPGINDNGSGAAALIAIAEELAEGSADTNVRFAFWAAEELGLHGSTHYVNSLPPEELDDITAYVNFDMLASTNHVRWIYDEPGSPEGSDDIAALFEDYFDSRNLTSRPFAINGNSDHGPFLRAGVPIGGIFSGSDEVKTPYLERLFPGEADAPMDPCYHLACDTLENIDREALSELAGAAAYVIVTLAD